MSITFYLILITFGLFLVIIYFALRRKYCYWKSRDVPHLPPTFLLGNYGEYILLKKYMGAVVQDLCTKFSDAPYIGAYYGTEPVLIVQDPDLLKLINIKEFEYFNSRELSEYSDKEPTTQTMFFYNGHKWNVSRQCLTPLFTTAKMKIMFHLILRCTNDLEKMMLKETSLSEKNEVRSLMIRYTMDCIMSCALGVETNTMEESSTNNPFTSVGDMIFEPSNTKTLKLHFRAIWPYIFYTLGFKVWPKEISSFFYNLAINVFKQRNYQPSSRNDFVDLMLNLKNNANKGQVASNKLNIEYNDTLLVGQCVLLFATGFETTAATLSYVLYELAKNAKAQKLAVEEIDEYLSTHNNIEFDCITKLEYLDACITEALRLYPALGVVTREVVQDYQLPSGLILEKGLRIHIPVYHLHHNSKNFEEPENFKPERFFSRENAKNIKQFTFMPFGEGPRTCIGSRMAKMIMIPALVTILRDYTVELSDDTPKNLELDPRGFVTLAKDKIILKFVRKQT